MNNQEINSKLMQVLQHEAPVVFGSVASDVQEILDSLKSAGNDLVKPVESAILACAAGSNGGPSWWNGAQELCKTLATLKSDEAKKALLSILKTDSNIYEYQSVRSTAASELAGFADRSLVPGLLEIAKTQNAPAAAIMKTLETLGYQGNKPPQAIIDQGINMSSPADKVQHFKMYVDEVTKWPNDNQAAYWWFFGNAIERVHGRERALPYYASGLKARSAPQAAAWQKFNNVTPSPDSAAKLAKQYPMPKDNPEPTAPIIPNVPQSSSSSNKKWWEFWK
jgi:hypothetical protein